MTERMTVTGGCHCGAVRFEAETDRAVTVLDCNCSMCARTGYLHLIVPAAAFQLLAGGDAIAEYRFNSGTARHLFCQTCGIKSFYVPRSHPGAYSLNVRALDDASMLDITIQAYDGRHWEAARASLARAGDSG